MDDTPPFVLRRLDVPVICRLNGPAAGYGTDLGLGCDVVIASDQASFRATGWDSTIGGCHG